MDLGMNAHEASYNMGWSQGEKRNHRPGVGNPNVAHSYTKLQKVQEYGEFPGGPVVRTPHFHCRGPQFNPWSGN